MKKLFKIIGYLLGTLLLIILLAGTVLIFIKSSAVKANYDLLGNKAPTLESNGHQYRDLNKNGQLDIYEDSRRSTDERVDNLIGQMNLEEKAGMMFITMIGMTDEGNPIDNFFIPNSPFDMMFLMGPPSSEMIAKRNMNSFNIVHTYDAEILAKFNNRAQKLAERTRLGIPITIGTDPRHGTDNNPGAAIYTASFSQWPSSLGLAATRDTVLVKEFGEIARQEYLATGIRLALHPMADLATEPRWTRVNGTFGEDAQLSSIMTKAYVLGFQGDTLNLNSVACMTKHFSGGGPQADGEDAHFEYGKDQTYPGNNFDYHIIPFLEGAFPANTAQIMPYYGIPVDQTDENVGFAFNKSIITTMLRDSLGFDGVICTDWSIINDNKITQGRAWGVEHLTPLQRTKKVIDAGCDQFGGENSTELIIELVETGQIEEARIDASIRRLLRDKFTMGLFDNPYVEADKASQITGKKAFREKGKIAQAKSTVLLKNEQLLPLKKGTKIFSDGIDNPDVFNKYGEIVDHPEDADVIILRILTPFDPRSDSFLEAFFHQGRLYYNEEEKAKMFKLIDQKPSIVIANLERPTILTEIDAKSKALLAEFGTSDEVLADLIFGISKPEGKLPFELPSSWEAVEKQFEDVPYDSENPLYEFGYGITYQN